MNKKTAKTFKSKKEAQAYLIGYLIGLKLKSARLWQLVESDKTPKQKLKAKKKHAAKKH